MSLVLHVPVHCAVFNASLQTVDSSRTQAGSWRESGDAKPQRFKTEFAVTSLRNGHG